MHQNPIIDLKAYPLTDRTSAAYVEILSTYREQLEQQQYCSLPGFVTEQARERLVAEVIERLPDAYRNSSRRNCFLQRTGDETLPQDHPANMFFEASYRMLAYDLFAAPSLLRALYVWEPLRQFVADLVGADRLHLSEDIYQPANVLCYGPGDRSAWHFDSTSAFTMTLMLQAADRGGDFKISPHTRHEDGREDDRKLKKLRSVLDGDETHVVTVPRDPGALVIFRGCTSVHSVSPVEGERDRLMAVFVYEDQPGIVGDPEVNYTVYGPRTRATE